MGLGESGRYRVCGRRTPGRISPHDLEIWNELQKEALASIAEFVRSQNSPPVVQVGHVGRKGSTRRTSEGLESGDLDYRGPAAIEPLQPGGCGWELITPIEVP